MKIKKALPLIIILILTTGFSYAFSNYYLRSSAAANGLSLGTELVLYRDGQKIDQELQTILGQNSLDLELSIRNNSTQGGNYKLILVGNKQQKSFITTGGQHRVLPVELAEQQEKKLSLTIEELSDGLNELFFILVKHDEKALASGEFIPPNLLFSYQTLKVFVNNNATDSSPSESVQVQEMPANNDNVFGFYLLRDVADVSPEGVKVLTRETVPGPGAFPLARPILPGLDQHLQSSQKRYTGQYSSYRRRALLLFLANY